MKRILRVAVMLVLAAGIGIGLNQAVLNRTTQGCIQLADFYKLEEDTVDLLCIGSSHVYYSINTCQLYDSRGIASYLLASPGQPVWLSYYFLEEALKTQSPQLVILDVCTMFRTEKDFGRPSLPSLISMKPSRVKWDAIAAMNEEKEVLDALSAFFSFPYYHTRYEELTEQDFKNTEHVRYNGYHADFTSISEDELEEWAGTGWKNIHDAKPVTPRTEHYLRKFIELCQDRDIPLLLVNAPFINHTAKKQRAYHYIGQIAGEYGVKFVDANDYTQEMQLDFSKDLLEASHLNYYGSVKYTDFLLGIIDESYALPDRREDTGYRHWERTSNEFRHRELLGRGLKEIQDAEDYRKAAKELKDCMAVIYNMADGEVSAYRDGKAVFEAAAGQECFRHFDLGKSDLTVSSSGGKAEVMLDGKQYIHVDDGINVLVYDFVAGTAIDSAGFDGQGKVTRKHASRRRR